LKGIEVMIDPGLNSCFIGIEVRLKGIEGKDLYWFEVLIDRD